MDHWDEAGRRRGGRRPGPHGRGAGSLRTLLPLRRPRLPRHRPQGDLRRQLLADIANDRLAARRAGAAVADLCLVEARRDQPEHGRPAARPARPEEQGIGRPNLGPIGSTANRAGGDGQSARGTAAGEGGRGAGASWSTMLNRGTSPQAVWDALFLGAGELLLRQPGIVALHAVTSTNALHYACQITGQRRDAPLADAAERLVRDPVPRRSQLAAARWPSPDRHTGTARRRRKSGRGRRRRTYSPT